MQTSLPEAMASVDLGTHYFSSAPELSPYKAIGIGSGLDKQQESRTALRQVLEKAEIPLVLDADALNIISEENWQSLIPANSILTPHPKEFERLFGASAHSFERLELAKLKAKQLQIYIILKGAHSLVVCPDGQVYFNSTGNPGMATAGSGDVLTGMVTSLLAQGYNPKDAALFGVFLHGLAGDLAAKEIGVEAMIAGDLVAHIAKGYKGLV
jgi:NAD(P)H-hydrate epimerase